MSGESLLLIKAWQRSSLNAGFRLLCLIFGPIYQMNIEINPTYFHLWYPRSFSSQFQPL